MIQNDEIIRNDQFADPIMRKRKLAHNIQLLGSREAVTNSERCKHPIQTPLTGSVGTKVSRPASPHSLQLAIRRNVEKPL